MRYFLYLYSSKPKCYTNILIPMNSTNLIELFCILDEFCKYFTPQLKKRMIDTVGKRRRNRACAMNDSEIMTILILYHPSHYIDLKTFYLHEIFLLHLLPTILCRRSQR